MYIVMSHESWVSGDPLGKKDHVCHTWERLELEISVTASETNQHYQTVGHFYANSIQFMTSVILNNFDISAHHNSEEHRSSFEVHTALFTRLKS